MPPDFAMISAVKKITQFSINRISERYFAMAAPSLRDPALRDMTGAARYAAASIRPIPDASNGVVW